MHEAGRLREHDAGRTRMPAGPVRDLCVQGVGLPRFVCVSTHTCLISLPPHRAYACAPCFLHAPLAVAVTYTNTYSQCSACVCVCVCVGVCVCKDTRNYCVKDRETRICHLRHTWHRPSSSIHILTTYMHLCTRLDKTFPASTHA